MRPTSFAVLVLLLTAAVAFGVPAASAQETLATCSTTGTCLLSAGLTGTVRSISWRGPRSRRR